MVSHTRTATMGISYRARYTGVFHGMYTTVQYAHLQQDDRDTDVCNEKKKSMPCCPSLAGLRLDAGGPAPTKLPGTGDSSPSSSPIVESRPHPAPKKSRQRKKSTNDRHSRIDLPVWGQREPPAPPPHSQLFRALRRLNFCVRSDLHFLPCKRETNVLDPTAIPTEQRVKVGTGEPRKKKKKKRLVFSSHLLRCVPCLPFYISLEVSSLQVLIPSNNDNASERKPTPGGAKAEGKR